MDCKSCRIGSIKPVSLMVEQVENPLGIFRSQPRFSWQIPCSQKGNYQKSYRIECASARELLEKGEADLWDSGTVSSNELNLVPYQGKPLSSLQGVYWRVRITDAFDKQGEPSDIAYFEMGLLDKNEWKGLWLTDRLYKNKSACYFRSDFNVKPGLKRARALVSGIGYNIVSINGARQGDAVLDPGWTTYDKRVQYRVHDITADLKEGENTIGVTLGEGWYHNNHYCFNGFSFIEALHWLGQPRFTAQLFFEYEDGSTQWIYSRPEDWKSSYGPIIYNDVFNGEHYDARLEMPGWDTPAAKDWPWRPAKEIEGPGGELEPAIAEPIKIIREMKPISVSQPKEGIYVYDMGQNFAGWAEIKVNAPKDTKITLKFAEMLYEDGTVNQENMRWAENRDIYFCKGTGEETFEPHFTYHGFRFVQMEGATPDQCTITGKVVRSAVRKTGTFSCSDEMLNRIQTAVLWTEESNLHSVPTDCPQRDERQGWTNDVSVRAEETIYNFGMGAFYRKWMKDLVDEQGADGSITDVAPRCYGSIHADPICSVFLLIPWFNYMFYGDDSLINEYYDNMCRWEDFLTSQSKDGIVQYSNYGDWAGPLDGCMGGWEANMALSAITPGTYMSTVFYYVNARLLAKIAERIGRNADIAKHNALADYIKEQLNKEFFNYETAQYALGSQASNSLALRFDLVPEGYREKVKKNLADDIRKHNGHLTTGNIATKYMLEALSDNDMGDLAFEIATQEDYPGWGYMFANGATTIWERWELGVTAAMNSHNHPMYCTISTWFFKHLTGIRPLEKGFDRILVAPQPVSGLTDASAIMETVRGNVASGWKKQEDKLIMDVIIPFGASALVRIPKEYGAVYSGENCVYGANGFNAEEGISGAQEKDGCIELEISSGRYAFVAVKR